MIYTITFNPALDYVINVDDLTIGTTNKTTQESIFYGGKGLNVSTILHNLGVNNKALGFIAGFTGNELEQGLSQRGLDCTFIKLPSGNTRINVKIKGHEETEINASGPSIDKDSLNKLYDKLKQLQDDDILVLAGSIPASLSTNTYQDIMEMLKDKKIKYIVDATNDLLLNVLDYHPFLIKPNLLELEEIFKVKITSDEDIIKYAKRLQDKGAINVLISLGKDGCLLVDEHHQIHRLKAYSGSAINTVGAGDSMVAGFIAGYVKYHDYKEALKLASACGSATAFTSDLATKEQIYKLLK